MLDDLDNGNVYVINTKLKFYALAHGLIQLSSKFQLVLQNREDRQFLGFNHIGKAGLKLLRENIIVIKSKATSDRMLLVSITENENSFFFQPPLLIINNGNVMLLVKIKMSWINLPGKFHQPFRLIIM